MAINEVFILSLAVCCSDRRRRGHIFLVRNRHCLPGWYDRRRGSESRRRTGGFTAVADRTSRRRSVELTSPVLVQSML